MSQDGIGAHHYKNFRSFNSKTVGVKLTPTLPCGFSNIVSSKERVKPWFFETFNIIISNIFPENFIEILQVVQKI